MEKVVGPRKHRLTDLRTVHMRHHRVMHWFDLRQVTSLNIGLMWQRVTQQQLPSLTELVTNATKWVENGVLHQLTSLTVTSRAFDSRLLSCTRLVKLECEMQTILSSEPVPLFSAGQLQKLTLHHSYQEIDEMDNLWQLKTQVMNSRIRELHLRFYHSDRVALQLRITCDGLRDILKCSSEYEYDFTSTGLIAHINYRRDV